MVILFCAWIVLSWMAAGIGLLLLAREDESLARDSRGHAEDVILLAAWLGIGAMATAAFVVALLVPLTAAVSGLIGTIIVAIAYFGWYRALPSRPIRTASKSLLAILCILALILAERSTQVGNLDDAGGYHWSLIRWYREAGVPVGLGLFQWRLATHSSWLALTALLDHGPMMSRTGNILNGLVLLWMLTHLVVAGARMIRRSAGKPDIFVAAAIVGVVPGMLGWDMRLSPSPDVPVILLAIVVAWAWLEFRAPTPARPFALPLLALSAFAVTVKLSALPLLASMAAVAIWEGRRQSWHWRLFACAAAAPAGAVLAASLMSTGCLAFPSPVLCFDVSWGVGADTARAYSRIVNSTAPRNVTDWLVASAVALASIAVRRKSLRADFDLGLVAMAAVGIGFALYFAPTTRFGLGYLVLLPALAVAHYASPARAALDRLPPTARTALGALLLAAIAIHFLLPLYKEFVYAKLRARAFETLAERKRGDASINAPNQYWYLVPNRVGYEGPFALAQAPGFAYWVSARGNCWDHALPCASNPELSFIPVLRLRDEAKGLRFGFARRDRD